MDAPPDYAAQIDAWRLGRVERLVSESGWLSLTGLFWLEEGDNPVGADPSNVVMLPENSPRRVGTIRLEGGRAVFVPASASVAESAGKPVTGPVTLSSDASDSPTIVAAGSALFHLVERDGRLAARVRDVDHPARRLLRPIPVFPIDPAWRLEVRVEPYAPLRRIPVPSILGTVALETSPGAVVFSMHGHEHRLDAILERGEIDWWIVFGDLTNGRETYAGGRFVYVAPPVRGRTILDFNKAYNPPCVFTPHSTCPLPPAQNRLAIRVEAGERTYV